MEIEKPIVQEEERLRPSKSEVMKLISDNRLAKDIMNWSPAVSLDEGLQRTIDFVRTHLSFYQTDRYVR